MPLLRPAKEVCRLDSGATLFPTIHIDAGALDRDDQLTHTDSEAKRSVGGYEPE